jgi:methylated-DNA-[protein]-cysteine S-methyltransferase
MTRKRFTDFASRVLAAVCRIPPGRLATYGDIARIAGRPRAARAVGNIMRVCNQPGAPCHRVVAAGGRLGGYGGNIGLKRSLLRAEGVRVVGSRIRDAAERRWPGLPARGGHDRPGPSSSQRRPKSAPTAVCGNPGPSGVVSFNGLRR